MLDGIIMSRRFAYGGACDPFGAGNVPHAQAAALVDHPWRTGKKWIVMIAAQHRCLGKPLKRFAAVARFRDTDKEEERYRARQRPAGVIHQQPPPMHHQISRHRAAIVERAKPAEIERWFFGRVNHREPAVFYLHVGPRALRAVLVVTRGEVHAITVPRKLLHERILTMRA